MTDKTVRIDNGHVVSLNYTLRSEDGEIIHHQSASDPLVYLHGANNLVPGLERALTGKCVGDKLSVAVPPEDAYGTRSSPGPQPVPRSAFGAVSELRPGMPVEARGPDGESFALWIVSVDAQTVQVDSDHPLAGLTLNFNVEVTSVREASALEITEGRPLQEAT